MAMSPLQLPRLDHHSSTAKATGIATGFTGPQRHLLPLFNRYFSSNHCGNKRNGPEKPTVAAITRQYRQLDLMLLCVVLENPIAVHAG